MQRANPGIEMRGTGSPSLQESRERQYIVTCDTLSDVHLNLHTLPANTKTLPLSLLNLFSE